MSRSPHVDARSDDPRDAPRSAPSRAPNSRSRIGLLLAGVILIALNMRAAITSVGPVLGQIRSDLGLSAVAAGVLGTLPLIAFGLGSPFAPAVARRLGIERTMFVAVCVLVVGIVVRSIRWVPAVFIGTAALGTAIAMLNVLLPALLKRDFPGRVPAMTGLYTTVMGTMAALASGIAVPIASAAPAGWQIALGCWAGLALIALAVWAPQLRERTLPPGAGGPPVKLPWRSPLAWQVTAFMGLQSLGFYVAVSWLPSILADTGLSETTAGWGLSLMQLTGLIASACAPLLAGRRTDLRALTAGAALVPVVAYVGLITLPGFALGWAGLMGFGQGFSITMALSFFALRAADERQASALSGMGQSVGYLLAAVGPPVIGALHDAAGSWTPPLLVLICVSLGHATAALGAGRPRTLIA